MELPASSFAILDSVFGKEREEPLAWIKVCVSTLKKRIRVELLRTACNVTCLDSGLPPVHQCLKIGSIFSTFQAPQGHCAM